MSAIAVPPALEAAIAAAESRFGAANPRSRAHHERAQRSLPGGHTRQTLLHGPFPLTVEGGEGARLTDLDGHTYIDLVGDYAAGVYGHSCSRIQQEAISAVQRGMSLGALSAKEAELAELIRSRIPSLEQVRFCNSGTEACLFSALLARHFTQRSRLLAFRGAYHGGFMVFGDPDPPLNAPFDVVKCTYNSTQATRDTLRSLGNSVAAVIIEPMMGAGGCIPAEREFLAMLRDETQQVGTLLIFDEVMTARLAPNGLQGFYGVRPDITALGKFWGGGFNFGAVGGSRNIMRHLDSLSGGSLSQGGTFNNNAVTMATGLAGARDVYTPAACTELNARGDRLRVELNALGRSINVPFQVTGLGAVMNIHWHRRPIRCPADTEPASSLPRRLFQLEMMLNGFYVAQRGFVTLSLALSEQDTKRFKEAVQRYLEGFAPILNEAAAG